MFHPRLAGTGHEGVSGTNRPCRDVGPALGARPGLPDRGFRAPTAAGARVPFGASRGRDRSARRGG